MKSIFVTALLLTPITGCVTVSKSAKVDYCETTLKAPSPYDLFKSQYDTNYYRTMQGLSADNIGDFATMDVWDKDSLNSAPVRAEFGVPNDPGELSTKETKVLVKHYSELGRSDITPPKYLYRYSSDAGQVKSTTEQAKMDFVGVRMLAANKESQVNLGYLWNKYASCPLDSHGLLVTNYQKRGKTISCVSREHINKIGCKKLPMTKNSPEVSQN